MADDRKDHDAPDRSRVKVHEDHEGPVSLSQKWGITKETADCCHGKSGGLRRGGRARAGQVHQMSEELLSQFGTATAGSSSATAAWSAMSRTPSSGGQTTETPIDEFWSGPGTSLQKPALRKLLGE